jgi:hypothetical protein
MLNIRQVLSRRSDLSTFLVHLTREYPEGTSPKENLKSILIGETVEARNPYGAAVYQLNRSKVDSASLDTQKVVCFTETPLEHVQLISEPISGRNFRFGPYVIAITKRVARQRAVNPVRYLDITPGHNWLTMPLNSMVNDAINKGDFKASDVARLTPFIEQMGPLSSGSRKEFWWEREWRHVGDFRLASRFIVICPEKDFSEVMPLCHENIRLIDPEWSLEQIIGRLAGFDAGDIDPF